MSGRLADAGLRASSGTRLRWAGLAAANLFGVAAFGWPFLLPAAAGEQAHESDAPYLIIALSVCLGVALFAHLDGYGMGPKTVALIGVLGAAMVALRLPGFVAGFSAMFVVVLVAGNSFGPSFGFLLGATGTLASGLFVGGLGPWLPFQMVAVGWVGLGAGLLPRRGAWPVRIGALALYGAVSGFAFGAVMNLWSWPFVAAGSAVSWSPAAGAGENLRHYAAYYAATSAAWDSFRAVGNAVLVLVAGRPLLAALDRSARRMGPALRRRVTAGSRVGDNNPCESRPGGRGPDSNRVEESPDSIGQGAGESPRRGDPRPVPQKQTASGNRGKGETVR